MKKEKLFLFGNWKMHGTPAQIKEYFQILRKEKKTFSNPHLLWGLFLPAPFLTLAQKESKNFTQFMIGAQNAHWEKQGAYTGELSGPILGSINIKHVLVGHSERRKHFGETYQTAIQRALSLLKQGFAVTFCIGETQQERLEEKTFSVLHAQLQGISSCPLEYLSQLTIAYEPIWAIGTGQTATQTQIQTTHAYIKDFFEQRFPQKKIPILYGGSVHPKNISSILSLQNIDGVLVGGASLDAQKWIQILKAGACIINSHGDL